MNRKPYHTDLTDTEWHTLRERLPNARGGRAGRTLKGRPRKHDLREILNAMRYQNQYGCAWRDLPRICPLGRRSMRICAVGASTAL